MLVKVCGMREPGNVKQVAQLGVDMMGFIFYPKSPRYMPVMCWLALMLTAMCAEWESS